MTYQHHRILTSAAILAATSAAVADTNPQDIIVVDSGEDQQLSTRLDSKAEGVSDVPQLLQAAEPDLFTGGDYLVAEQHDGTWVGGGGNDVVVRDPRPRTLRERLFLGNAAGGFAVASGLAVLAWVFIRRRRR